ncbi:MAG: hypothetical protein FH761_16710 [Firmicutes bacterium]|nr:hypothetical protein [Bacillota bacterium]
MYKCIKGFCLEICDDDGFTIEGESMVVKEGSEWHIPSDKDFRLIDGEVRLENNENWIEISKERFEKCFAVIF